MEALTQMSISGEMGMCVYGSTHTDEYVGEMVEMCVYGCTHADEYVGGDGGDACVWKHSHR